MNKRMGYSGQIISFTCLCDGQLKDCSLSISDTNDKKMASII